MTAHTDVDAFTQAITDISDCLLRRWLPITLTSFAPLLHLWAPTQTWTATTAAVIAFGVGALLQRYWVLCLGFAAACVACTSTLELSALNAESWGALSTACLFGAAAAQYVRPRRHRAFEWHILRRKLPYPHLMVSSVSVPPILSYCLWATSGAGANIWLVVHTFVVLMTLCLGIYYAWTYTEK